MNPVKPFRQLELIAVFLNPPAVDVTNPAAFLLLDGSLIVMPVASLDDGEAAAAVRGLFFAEVNLPHHTVDAVYGYTFHIFNKLNHEPAIVEVALLQQEIERIHARYAGQTLEVSYA